jgi:predicted transposase YdaD
MSRVARRELGGQETDIPVRLHSVIIYTGTGAGTNDTGHYQIRGTGDSVSLAWRYEPLLLWQMEAEELLQLGQPAFLALVGQTRLREPERILPEVVAQIRAMADPEQKGRLLTALTSLISDKEALEMVEKLIEKDELLDTPYLHRIREEGREEGLKEGTEAGRVQGKEEGLELGRLEGLREAIRDTITIQFNPSVIEYRQVDRQLKDLTQQEQLQQVLAAAIQAETMAAFTTRLAEIVPAK